MNYYLGVDIGKEGALALLNQKQELMELSSMPLDRSKKPDFKKVFILIQRWHLKYSIKFAVVERQFRQGSVREEGKIWGICLALGLNVREVSPQTWQKYVKNIDIKAAAKKKVEGLAKSYPDFKGTKLRAFSQVWSLYPRLTLLRTSRCTKPSDGFADAILIAIAALHIHTNNAPSTVKRKKRSTKTHSQRRKNAG